MRAAIVLAAGAAMSVAAVATAGIVTPDSIGGMKIGHAYIDLTDGGHNNRQTPIYSNITNSTGFYANEAGNPPVADDLHMVSGGNMVEFTFGYVDATDGIPVNSLVCSFYANDPADSTVPPANPIASYNVTGLPGDGAWLITVTVPAVAVPMDIWAETDYSATANAGPLIYDPPTLGSSHDLFASGGTLFFFGGDPHANFAWEIAVPAPGSMALLGLGGLVAIRRRR